MSWARPCRRRARGRVAPTLLALVLALAATPDRAAAQEPAWSARVFVEAFSVEDADDWLALRQQVDGRFSDGRRLELGVVQTRRFGTWDASLEAGTTLRPGDLNLSLDTRLTPAAEILEDLRLGVRAALPMGELVPSVGYRLQLFPEGAVHTASPRLEWYRGRWLLSGELRVIRSAVETVNVAGIARVTRRLGASWRAWVGLAAGEEDFLVGRAPARQLRTLTTRSLSGGAAYGFAPAWTLRVDLTGVDSDPRLDRIGGALTLTRTF